MFEPPTTEDELPRATLAMIVDEVACIQASSEALAAKRTFRWFAPFPEADAGGRNVSTASLLFVCDPAQALDLLEAHPAAFAIVVPKGASAPEGVPVPDSLADEKAADALPDALFAFAGRYVVAQGAGKLDVLLQLDGFFCRLLAWNAELERIMLKHGSFMDMLNVGARLMRNFMFMSDNALNIIAYSDTLEPPDEFHRTIIRNRSLMLDDLVEERFRLPEGRFYSREPAGDVLHTRLSAPVHFSHMYCGSISMACDHREDTQGLRDLFTMFLQYALPLCSEIWGRQAELRMPSAVFLVRLLEQQPMEDSYVREQMRLLGLQEAGQFKLVIVEQDEYANLARNDLILQALTSLNGGRTYVFPFRSHILAFCYASANRATLTRERIQEELANRLFEPHGMLAGVSCTFYDLMDIDMAYRQACIALGFKTTILREHASVGDREVSSLAFEEALLYYLIDAHGADGRFMDVVFRRTVASILHEEDAREGTNVSAILWHYLGCEGSATMVARRLHIHRNTVLYHVDKLQKRFGFDLSDRTVREWLTLGYKRLFLSVGNESVERTLSNAKPGPYRIAY